MTFSLDQWSIVPGPASIQPPFQSTQVGAIEEYSPEVVAETILAIPGAELIQPAEPDWWSWMARWSSNESYIDLTMTLFDTLPMLWGGFKLAGPAGPQDLLELYIQLHAALPATWLHNAECELHSAESFGVRIRAA